MVSSTRTIFFFIPIFRTLTIRMSKWHNGYGRISSPTEDTDESVDETKDFLLGPSFPRIKDSKNRPIFILTAINIIILVIALILFSIGFHNDYHGRNPKLRQVHSYSMSHMLIRMRKTINTLNKI